MEDQHDNIVLNTNQSVKWYLYQLCEESSDIIDEFRGYMNVPTTYQSDDHPLLNNVDDCELTSAANVLYTRFKFYISNWLEGCKRCIEILNRYHGCPCKFCPCNNGGEEL